MRATGCPAGGPSRPASSGPVAHQEHPTRYRYRQTLVSLMPPVSRPLAAHLPVQAKITSTFAVAQYLSWDALLPWIWRTTPGPPSVVDGAMLVDACSLPVPRSGAAPLSRQHRGGARRLLPGPDAQRGGDGIGILSALQPPSV